MIQAFTLALMMGAAYIAHAHDAWALFLMVFLMLWANNISWKRAQ